MAIINIAAVLLGVAVASAMGQENYVLAKRVDVASVPLDERATFIGGWALGGGITTCPNDTLSCTTQLGTTNYPGICCPSSTFCVGQGLGLGVVCCPTSDNCGAPLQTIPTCANSTWTLYNGIRKYFCCAPGEIGIFPNGGLSDLVGLCIPDDQNAPASVRATPVGGGSSTSSGTVAASTGATTKTVSSSSVQTSVSVTQTTGGTVSPTATTTKSSGMANVVSLASIIGGVVSVFMLNAFF